MCFSESLCDYCACRVEVSYALFLTSLYVLCGWRCLCNGSAYVQVRVHTGCHHNTNSTNIKQHIHKNTLTHTNDIQHMRMTACMHASTLVNKQAHLSPLHLDCIHPPSPCIHLKHSFVPLIILQIMHEHRKRKQTYTTMRAMLPQIYALTYHLTNEHHVSGTCTHHLTNRGRA